MVLPPSRPFLAGWCFPFVLISFGGQTGQDCLPFRLIEWLIVVLLSLNTIAMINWPDCWKEKCRRRTNWFLRIIRTLERFQLWTEVKNCYSGSRNIKNSFLCFALHAISQHTWAMCLNSNVLRPSEEKLLHKLIIYHNPKHETTIVVVAQAPTDTSPGWTQKEVYELKIFFCS